MMVISKDLFIENRKRFTVLSKNHQILVKMLMNLDISIVLSGNNYSMSGSKCFDEDYKCN